MSGSLEIDELKMYFGEPFKVNSYITITPPTVGSIIEWGETRYFHVVSILTGSPANMKSWLFDLGIDYEAITDYELFMLLCQNLRVEDTSILFGDFDFTKLSVSKNEDNEEDLFLKNEETGAILDRLAFIKIRDYLRKLHEITPPKRTKAANQTTKRILIQLEKEEILTLRKNGCKSQLKPLISAMMRYPGFKYKSSELKQCSLYEFMDTVKGAQTYVSSTALLKGCYSGMIDTSKINKKELNWMRENK